MDKTGLTDERTFTLRSEGTPAAAKPTAFAAEPLLDSPFERARDPSHTRTLADADLRGMFEANGLVLLRSEVEREEEDVGEYLDRAGCVGEAREEALAVAPARGSYVKEVGWYLLRKPGF